MMEHETDGYDWGDDWGYYTTKDPKRELRKKKIDNLQQIMKKNDNPVRKITRKLKFW